MSSHQHKSKAAKALFRSNSLTCFYSGIKLRTDQGDSHGLKASIEHLVPVSTIKQGVHGIKKNKVPCATCINSMIGNAPLVVKYALKDFFKTFTFHPALNDKDIVAIMKHTVSIFLEDYKIHGMVVWSWHEYLGKKKLSKNIRLERKRELYADYLLLLTEEEMSIEAYKKWRTAI